ncbi:hypothetical protein G647_06473 [Cladophialophora carrionii CBS 160.54]|uniref:Uncharacterized protein n=1 Tax=Cladophialophora carrionii CBS 160.54 TaxID=1279043 RepID=V9D7Y0_9EURO|nr:uncharacterized protein G647_06473 [Cladophialophora carrionii CBS 160.54]ETI22398.1 hypothetical protein G647_06473 [Cladophialophora carrionii CBS 160.54]
MDPITNPPGSSPHGEPIDMDQIELRVSETIASESLPAPLDQWQQMVQSLASSLPQGMTLGQQAEVRDMLRRHPIRHIPNLVWTFNRSLPPPAEYPLLDEHRRHIVNFVREELWAGNTDADRIVAAMARLFQGALARRPQLCSSRLLYEFTSLIRERCGQIWLGSLFHAHLNENARQIERLSTAITSDNRLSLYQFTQLGEVYIFDKNLAPRELRPTDEEGKIDDSDDEDPVDDDDSADDGDSVDDDDDVYVDRDHIAAATAPCLPPPHWLEKSTIIRRDPQSQRTPVYRPEIEDAATLNLLIDRQLDISSLREAFRHVNDRYTAMAENMMVHPRYYVLLALEENDTDIRRANAPNDYPSLENASLRQDALEHARNCLSRVHGRLFDVERYIIAKEERLLAAGRKVRAYSSRYERTRRRYFLRWLIAGLHDPKLRDQFNIPSSVQPAPMARPYEGGDPCPVCCEALERMEVVSPQR